ncbi:hypothetical protein ABW21_db0206342 [Orbilia brochopaga]|nr:hypothetical protein ABW21_db0206342 [Drechslerella brochopaga]
MIARRLVGMHGSKATHKVGVYVRRFSTTSPAVDWKAFAEGNLRQGVLLDTSLLSTVLEKQSLCEWLRMVREKSGTIGVCRWSPSEYTASPFLIAQGTKANQVEKVVKKIGWKVIPGLGSTLRSTEIAEDVVGREHTSLMKGRPADVSPAKYLKTKKGGKDWTKVLKDSHIDVALAAEGHSQ